MRFSARRNCPRERWGWRRLIGNAFHRRGPAAPNARSPRHVRVRDTTHVTASDDRSWQRPTAATSWVDSRLSSTVGLAHAALWILAWPTWTELVDGLEASAVAGEQTICGRAVGHRWSDVHRMVQIFGINTKDLNHPTLFWNFSVQLLPMSYWQC